jgi:FkbM family methyltransferase
MKLPLIKKTKQIVSPYKQPLVYLKHKLYPRQSYSQHQEDIFIENILGKIESFIDIGANDGISCSNTFLFALAGAEGLCIEPVSSNFSRLSLLYFLNKKVKCIKTGISNKSSELEIRSEGLLSYITETQDPWGKENLAKFMTSEENLEKIQVKTLMDCLNDYPKFCQCDLVSLDIEGHELQALQGINFAKFRTKCFIIETMGGKHHQYQAINSLLKKVNYHPVIQNCLNTFWFYKDVRELIGNNKFREICKDFKDYQVLF